MLSDAIRVFFADKTRVEFASGDRKIRGTMYYPQDETPAPGVLVLHTAMGLTPHEHMVGVRLAREGYAALVISYSKRTTGDVVKDVQRGAVLAKVVHDSWDFLRNDQRVDAKRTAIIGYSLGGHFATYLSTLRFEEKPKAVVVYYGFYPHLNEDSRMPLGRQFAPTLILQGDKDSSFFVETAKHAERVARPQIMPFEVIYYPDAGHQFDLFQPDSKATADAWSRTLAFLRQHLNDKQ